MIDVAPLWLRSGAHADPPSQLTGRGHVLRGQALMSGCTTTMTPAVLSAPERCRPFPDRCLSLTSHCPFHRPQVLGSLPYLLFYQRKDSAVPDETVTII